MISTRKIGILGLGFSALLALAGCQSDNVTATPSHDMSSMAVRCDKCQTTWVKEQYTGGSGKSHAIGYRDVEKMSCPDCEERASNFFKTGKLMEHHCKACGGNMEPCAAH